MSVTKFELKEEHVKLLTKIQWNLQHGTTLLVSEFNDVESQVLVNIYEEVDLILNGRLNTQDSLGIDFEDYTTEQKAEWDKLLSELPIALDIILYTGKTELGLYNTKFNVRAWRKYPTSYH